MFLPHIKSTRLAGIILDLHGRSGEHALKLGDGAFDVMDEHLYPLAKRFKDAHRGKKMEVGIIYGSLDRPARIQALGVINDKTFMPMLKEEAKFLIPNI